MKVALVYDRVNKFGGAERVIKHIHEIFPDAPLYTLVYEPSKAPWADDIQVLPSFLNSIPFFRTRHELLAPVGPLAFETHDLKGYDVIISITSSDAKSVITRPHQLHVCYCLTPTRYFWSGKEEYSDDIKMKIVPRKLLNLFRTTDLLTSSRVDEYIAISNEVKNRINKYYNRRSAVLYPAIDDKFYSQQTLPMSAREYYLAVGRLVRYKKMDLAIEAFNKLKLPLVVVGDGEDSERLKSLAGPSISFVGAVDDDRLIQYYRRAKALIFPQEEDYGLIPIEAQAQGTPVIAYGKGGALETVLPGKTGIYFYDQSEQSLMNAVRDLKKMKLRPEDSVNNARKFNLKNFREGFEKQIKLLWKKHQKNI